MKRLHRIVPLAVAGLLLFSACGENAGVPGAAVTMDGKTISMADVDKVAGLWCELGEDDIRNTPEQSPVAMSQLKGQVAAYEMLNYAARAVAEERGVTPGSAYEEAVKSNKAAVEEAGMDEEDAEKLLPALNAGAYIQSIAEEIGLKELDGEPSTDPTQQAGTIGGDIIIEWVLEREPRFSPELGLEFTDDGTLQPADTSLSAAVSDFAAIPIANQNPAVPQAEPDLSYLDELPADQVCGEVR